MDGKGRAIDNIFIERLWRSVKYEYIYINPPVDGLELYRGLKNWFTDYKHGKAPQVSSGERFLPQSIMQQNARPRRQHKQTYFLSIAAL